MNRHFRHLTELTGQIWKESISQQKPVVVDQHIVTTYRNTPTMQWNFKWKTDTRHSKHALTNKDVMTQSMNLGSFPMLLWEPPGNTKLPKRAGLDGSLSQEC